MSAQERKLTAEVSARRLAEQAGEELNEASPVMVWWGKNREYLKEAVINSPEVRLESPSTEPATPGPQPQAREGWSLGHGNSRAGLMDLDDFFMPICKPDPSLDPLQTSLELQQASTNYAQAIKNVNQLMQGLEEAKRTLNQRHTETINIINTQYHNSKSGLTPNRETLETASNGTS